MAQDVGKWVGFDLGGTKMLSVVYDENFKPLGRKRRKTKALNGLESGVDRLLQTIHDAIKDSDIDPKQLEGIGIGCPGTLNLEKGILEYAPNLGWHNLHVEKLLQEEFGCPAVLANDVDLGVYGEFCFGAGQDAHNVLGVFPGTGIGGGFVYEGKILTGKKTSCMEIGHWPLIPDGPMCGCGKQGCLEAVASRLAISAAVVQAAFRGDAPHLAKVAGTELSNVCSSLLAESIEKGDLVIEEIVRTAARHIGTAVAGLVHLLAPDIVILGGGLVEAMENIFVEEVEETAKQRVMPTYRKSFKVVPAELEDDAAVLGAAAWASKSLKVLERVPKPGQTHCRKRTKQLASDAR